MILAFQDVKLASDSMDHENIATTNYGRGASAQLVAAYLRELVVMRAYTAHPGIGDTEAFN